MKKIIPLIFLLFAGNSAAAWVECLAQTGAIYNEKRERVGPAWPGIDVIFQLDGDRLEDLTMNGWTMVCDDLMHEASSIEITATNVKVFCVKDQERDWTLTVNRINGDYEVWQNRNGFSDWSKGTCDVSRQKF
jgi:hypothetical protein